MSTNTTKSINGTTMSGGTEYSIDIEAHKSLICPYCHTDIEVQPTFFLKLNNGTFRVLLKCKKCDEAFIGHYIIVRDRTCLLTKLIGGNLKFTDFSKNINEASPNFVKIYNQSEHAEKENLEEISGIGYRKALEFLIKDFLIAKNPEKEDEIKRKFLGNVIKDYLDNERIKGIAERASWLGNDETHYTKVWNDKDVHDLKKMINIIVNYIDTELLTDSYLESMQKI